VPITASFPLVGIPVPESGLSDADLADYLARGDAHWLYHLQFLPPGTPAAQRFTPARPEWIGQLLGYLAPPGRAAEVVPLEVFPGAHKGTALPPFAFPIPLRFKGSSWSLTVAVGLAGLVSGQEIPPWVVCSGCLPFHLDPFLRLEPIGRVEEKVELCLGRKPEFDLRHLVNRMYAHRVLVDWLGPRDRRSVSGEVRLLILSRGVRLSSGRTVDGLPQDYLQRLGLIPVETSLDDFRLARDLYHRVRELGRGELLVVQVPTVWHALALLGLQTGAGYPADLLNEPLYGFRAQRRGGQQFGGSPETSYRELKSREAVRELERQLQLVPWGTDRLRRILKSCLHQLECQAGLIARLDPTRQWLEVLTFSGEADLRDALPAFLPAREGVRHLALATKRTQIVTSQAEFQRLLRQQPAKALMDRHYSPEQRLRYNQLVERIGGCVTVPLVRGDDVLGILCVHRKEEGRFPLDGVYVLEQLAQCAAVEVARQLDNEQAVTRRRIPGRARDLARRIASMPLANACEQLGQELAREARMRSGAYRTAVRLLTHDRRSLNVVGLAGDKGSWPEDFGKRSFERTEANACNHALSHNESYRIADTRSQGIHYKEVFPPAAAHLAIIIRSGLEPIGVLSVDFDSTHREFCTEEMEKDLEDLAALYACHLHSFSTDRLCEQLDACLPQLASWDASQEVLGHFLRVAGIALGATDADLFLRTPGAGCYQLMGGGWWMVGGEARRASLRGEAAALSDAANPSSPSTTHHPPSTTEVLPGVGRTGWVVENRQVLRIDDCGDPRELARVRPRIQFGTSAAVSPGQSQSGVRGQESGVRSQEQTPSWNKETEHLAYLGVPIQVGEDVLGVLRFLCKTPKPSPDQGSRVERQGKWRFTSLDEQMGRAAASRLGAWLYRLEQARHDRALSELIRASSNAPGQPELCAALHCAVEQGIGECVSVIRVADQREDQFGKVTEVMARLSLNHPDEHSIWPRFQLRGQGIAGEAWDKKKTIRVDDTRDSALRARMRKRFGDERWWDHVGCGFVTPLLAHDEVVGTLGIGRTHPHTLLDADIAFVEKVAEIASHAFKRLAEREEQIQNGLLWAVTAYLLDRDSGGPESVLRARLLREVADTITTALGGAVGYFWVATEPSGDGEGVWYSPVADHDTWNIPDEEVRQHLEAIPFAVVSEPETDHRLDFLLERLPAEERERWERCQRAVIRSRATAYRVWFPDLLFFVLVEPPDRLSYNRVVRVHRMLMATLVRLQERAALRPPHGAMTGSSQPAGATDTLGT
jgi:GAF domain-containing protein